MKPATPSDLAPLPADARSASQESLSPIGLEARTVVIAGLEFVLFELAEPRMQPARLTPAELAIVQLLRRGLPTGRIAALRGVSYRTVANQLAALYRKHDVQSRTELLARLKASRY